MNKIENLNSSDIKINYNNMPRKEFVDLVKIIKQTGQSEKMSKRDFIYLFDWYEKRTSGNVWRINEYLASEKLVIEPNYQNGWIDDKIELKLKEKARIKTSDCDNSDDSFDPISRLSLLKVSSRIPISVKRDSTLEKAYHLMWKNEYSQLPVMNDDRNVLGLITWQSIAKGLITNKTSKSVKDFMTNEFTILDETTPIFDAIKEVIKVGVVFVRSSDNKIKGPITPSDLNEQFIEQIEPYILLEQIENYIRLILHNKIVLEELQKLIKINEEDRAISSLSDMTFGGYIRVLQNHEMWNILGLPFDKADFENDLHAVRKIRNDVMHFHPDGISPNELDILRRISKFLMDFRQNC